MHSHSNNCVLIAIAALFLILLMANPSVSGQTFSRDEVIAKMRLVNDYWIAHHPKPGTNRWYRAVYFEGNIAMYGVCPDTTYYQYAVSWAEGNNWSLYGGQDTDVADNQCAGQTYIELYNYEPASYKIAAIANSISNMVNSTKIDYWRYIDCLHMSMPLFPRLGLIAADTNYFERMYQFFSYTKNTRNLYNSTDHLWYRDTRFLPPYQEPNGEDCYWSRGNGWVFAALARVLEYLPQNDSHRSEYIQIFQDMAEALRVVQRDDGFWNVSLHDPTNFGGPETSGTCLFIYGMAWGINNGLLDRNIYLPVVQKAWDGIVAKAIQPNGFLGFVQSGGDRPAPADSNNTTDFGVGVFLLAGSEIVKLFDQITVIRPNGGEIWNENSTHAIQWSSANTSGTVKIELSMDSGNNWQTIISATSDDGSYDWTLPEVENDKTNCYIRVTDKNNSSISDMSDDSFTIKNIQSCEITIASPNGGESWQEQSTHEILWTSQNTSGSVKIDYSVDGGINWINIVASTADNGSYSWILPEVSSDETQCLVKVSDAANSTCKDQSDAHFTITNSCDLGDVNMDGAITPGDALCAFQIYLNGGEPQGECNTSCGLIASDANCDGTITPGDALIIFLAYLNGKNPPLSCP